jgi:hypothetical protein
MRRKAVPSGSKLLIADVVGVGVDVEMEIEAKNNPSPSSLAPYPDISRLAVSK